MADPITWYALGRDVYDPETIEEAIDAKILTHNVDPSAHGQENESLYEHRAAELLDHVNYSIYNLKINPSSRVFKAIVASGGQGDFATLQAAIDYANLNGGGTVFILAGTYNLDDFVTLYENIELVGEGPGLTILNFVTAEKNLRVVGTIRAPVWESYGININTKTVTGVGTDFLTSVSPDDWIQLNNVWYKIKTVVSDTHLTLFENYRGPTISGAEDPYIVDFIENVKIKSLTVQACNGSTSSTASGVYISGVAFLEISDVVSRDNDKYGFMLETAWQCKISDCQGNNNKLSGFLDLGFDAAVFDNCFAYGNTDSGFIFQSGGQVPSAVTDCDSAHNGDHGFYINFATYYSFKGCNAFQNQDDGFRLYGSEYCKILGCHSKQNGNWGVNIMGGASPAVHTVVLGNTVIANTSGEITNAGTDSIVEHNQIT